MLGLQEIESKISSLTKKEYSSFRKWFYSYDIEQWDKKIVADSSAGNLDFLINEALEEKNSNVLTEL